MLFMCILVWMYMYVMNAYLYVYEDVCVYTDSCRTLQKVTELSTKFFKVHGSQIDFRFPLLIFSVKRYYSLHKRCP